jgi:esterase/lipase
MKKFELLRINDSLIKAMNYKNHEFAYAVFKNKQMIEEFLQELDFFNNVPPRYVEYENRRVELCKQTCRKDENGMDVVNNGRYEIQDQETFKTQMEKFHEEYKDEIVIRDQQVEQLNLILQEETVSPEFIKVKKGDLPVDIQTASELYEFSFMIE